MNEKRVAVVVLAAGSSKRMGQPKQMLCVADSTLLEKVLLQTLKSRAEKVFCVLGSAGALIEKSIAHLEVEVVMNPHFEMGLSSSIVAGIAKVDSDGFDSVLLVLGDQPDVDSAYLDLLIDTQASEKIVASSYDRRAGVPALIPRAYFGALRALEGDKGAQNFLNGSIPVIRIEGGCLVDLDSFDDYERYLENLA